VHLAAHLTPEAASLVCRHECRAQCCRGPLSLLLTADEVRAFRAHAAALGVELRLAEAPDGTGTIRFLDHPGEDCPMLDGAASICRIYSERPGRCRAFPEKPRPDCPVSGG
jgi:Fe-S-cluster containining protein